MVRSVLRTFLTIFLYISYRYNKSVILIGTTVPRNIEPGWSSWKKCMTKERI